MFIILIEYARCLKRLSLHLRISYSQICPLEDVIPEKVATVAENIVAVQENVIVPHCSQDESPAIHMVSFS